MGGRDSSGEIDAALEFAPHLDGLPMQEAWRSLARIIVIIYLVLTFGWAGSPGHFQAFALTVELLMRSYSAAEPRINGSEPFGVKTHVDDGCISTIKIGYRPFLEPRVYEMLVRLVFGTNAISDKKRREEGEPTQEGCWWGYIINTIAR